MAFLDNFVQIRNGGLAIEAEDTLKEVVQAIRDTGRKGQVTITLDVLPGSSGPDPDVIIIKGKVNSKIPKAEPKESYFFVNPQNGDLSINRVEQMDLGMYEKERA